MRQYPIWNIITACIYNSAKSYGVKETGEVEIRAGTSSKNSHVFLKHCTTHRQHDNGDKEFRFYVDGQLIKRAVLHKGESLSKGQRLYCITFFSLIGMFYSLALK